MKICNKCNVNKDLLAFKRDPRNKDGLQGICKDCNKTWQRERREARASGAVKLTAITEKTCNRCTVTKPANEFYKDTGCADGHSTLCKVCRNGSMAKWRDNNRAKYNENMRNFRADNPEWAKNNDLMRTHGISLEVYNAKKETQGGVCEMCKQPAKGTRPLVVDHNHATGDIRDLLCYGCNRALHVLEDEGLLEKAMEYLQKHNKG